MRAFVVNAFADAPFSGNPAGVVLLSPGDPALSEETMRRLAAELRHSETAYVSREGEKRFRIRYFTPEAEVPICGHATVASFSLLRELGLAAGGYTLVTGAGTLPVRVAGEAVWMTSAATEVGRELNADETRELLCAYGLSPEDAAPGLAPALAGAGLPDIMLPVRDAETLSRAAQNGAAVTELSRRYSVTGVHMFCPHTGVAARCRNFAPLYGIPEECATGTANSALTRYLYERGLVTPGRENLFIQGEAMGRRSEVRTVLTLAPAGPEVEVGGSAVTMMELLLKCL